MIKRLSLKHIALLGEEKGWGISTVDTVTISKTYDQSCNDMKNKIM